MHNRGRTYVDANEVLDQLSIINTELIPIHEDLLPFLPAGLELHDAVMVATALYVAEIRNEPFSLVTADARITQSGLVNVIW